MNDVKFNQMIALMREDAPTAARLSVQDKDARNAELERAKQTRPFYITAELDLDGVPGKTRIAYTDPQEFDLLVVGAITNRDDVRFKVSTIGARRSWSAESMPSWAVAGLTNQAVATNAPVLFTQAVRLKTRNRLSVEITNTPGVNNSRLYIAFLCYRVLPETDATTHVDLAADASALASINSADPQENVFVKMDVPFFSAGNVLKNRKTLEDDRPLLVSGIATNLANCTIRITDPSANLWSPVEVPIWAVAANYTLDRLPVRYLRRPFYLAPNTVLRADFTNGINGFNDGDGEVVFVCKTV